MLLNNTETSGRCPVSASPSWHTCGMNLPNEQGQLQRTSTSESGDVMAKKEPTRTGHSGLYLQLRRLYAIIHRERKAHPGTKVWKDLEEIAQQIHEIQQHWFHEGK